MTSLQHYLSDTQIVWENFDFASSKDFAVSEIWQVNGCDASASTLHRRVGNQDLKDWLHQTDGSNFRLDNHTTRKCVFRIVWIHRDTKRRLNGINEETFQKLRAAFKHELSHDYLQTQYAGIGAIDHATTVEQAYYLCNHPKLAVTWSQNTKSKSTSVICMADRFKLDVLQNLVGCQFIQERAALTMAPALMCGILSSKEVDIETGEVKRVVRHIEIRTGYHDWANRSECPARGDLVSLSAKISGGGSRIASNSRKLGVISEFCQFIMERMSEEQDITGTDGISSIVNILEKRTAMQALDLKYVRYRVEAQKEALFNLISTNNSETAQDIAENSRVVALATKGDARSMKVLALLTITFLPGTLVSGLFSTPLIERNSGDNVGLKIWTLGLILYVGVSASLVLLVFLTWYLWSLKGKSEIGRSRPVVRKNSLQGTTEVGVLALRRASTLGENHFPLPSACQL